MKAVRPAFPDGHFYSPIVNIDEISARQDRLWPREPHVVGIDFAPDRQREFLTKQLRQFTREYDYPEDFEPSGPSYQFFTRNPQFSWLDARVLFAMLRQLAPEHMIEVGSGYSSLLTADVSRRFLGGRLNFTCIDPYPRQVLIDGVPGITRLIPQKAEELPLALFERLRSGDVLFIDSSHVSKTGSDLNYIMFEIIPRLRVGVVIHFHDIFLPHDYPREWVLREGRSWNEQYLLQALLVFTNGFEVLFGSSYVFHYFPTELTNALDGRVFGGGSFWLRRAGQTAPAGRRGLSGRIRGHGGMRP